MFSLLTLICYRIHCFNFNPQLFLNFLAFKVCNDPVSDLLYDLCTTNDAYTKDRIFSMIQWILNLHETSQREENLVHSTNSYNGEYFKI